jgi:7-keto-8-aminopelargonate synthetase-like enzyme
MIATDGVFSMDGDIARLDPICDLAEKYGAMVMVDDSHATGFVGPTGRGTPEHRGAWPRRRDHLTLGKALGGASAASPPASARSSTCCATARGRTCSRTRWPRRSSPRPRGLDRLSGDDGAARQARAQHPRTSARA